MRQQPEATVDIEGKKIGLSNLKKPMWLKEGVTKGDLIEYYDTVAPEMLRYTRNRPLMLRRFPHGVDGSKSFVQKDWPHHPNWVQIATVQSHDDMRRSVRHVICNDKATLVWLAELACIEINQFLSSVGPDYVRHDILLVDLDPHKPAGFEEAVELGLAAHSALEHMGLKHIIKTTGHVGLHLLVPISPRYRIETLGRFAYLLGLLLEHLFPKIATTSRKEKDCVGKVYVDYHQNGLYRTVAAPYSLRPVPGALGSFPIAPDMLKRNSLDPAEFTIHTIPELVKKGRVVRIDFGLKQRLELGFREMGASP